MTLADAQVIYDKHRNLNGHIIKNKTILISKLFIAPTDFKKYDNAMFYLFQHYITMPKEYMDSIASEDVNIYALYYEKNETPGLSQPKIMALEKFIDEVIPLSELYNNIQ